MTETLATWAVNQTGFVIESALCLGRDWSQTGLSKYAIDHEVAKAEAALHQFAHQILRPGIHYELQKAIPCEYGTHKPFGSASVCGRPFSHRLAQSDNGFRICRRASW